MKPDVFDDFLPDFDAVRAQAIDAPFFDHLAGDGEIYKRVWIGEIPGLQKSIEDKLGPVDMLGMGFRLNYDGERPNAAVHSDLGWGTHALVLYFNEGPGGTAFWKHKATGARTIYVGDHELLAKVAPDWNDEAAWDLRELVTIKPNRALIYRSALFHSRYPFAAFGATPENGRLIAIAFFNLKEPRA